MAHAQYLLESLPELRIEDGIDERVDAAVDIAQPSGHVEGRVPGPPAQLELDADGVDDVAREKGYPATEEATWNNRRLEIELWRIGY